MRKTHHHRRTHATPAQQLGGAPVRFAACAAAMLVLGAAMLLGGGCAAAEKPAYMRHLTTVIEPADEMPEEIIMSFDLDRRKLPPGAMAGTAD